MARGIKVGDRIKEIRIDARLTQESFGEKIGLKKSSVSRIEKGKENLSNSVQINILREFSVNEAWLKYGIGEKYIEKEKKSIQDEIKLIPEMKLLLLQDYKEGFSEVQKLVESFEKMGSDSQSIFIQERRNVLDQQLKFLQEQRNEVFLEVRSFLAKVNSKLKAFYDTECYIKSQLKECKTFSELIVFQSTEETAAENEESDFEKHERMRGNASAL